MKDWIIVVIVVIISLFSLTSIYLVLSDDTEQKPDVGSDINKTEVDLYSDGEKVSTLKLETALTRSEKRTGLSDKEELNDSSGMIFIYDYETERNFVMPNMSFPIDIVFVGNNCRINAIFNAEKPASGESGYEDKHTYTSSAEFVIEVPYKYASDRVEEGDRIHFDQCEL